MHFFPILKYSRCYSNRNTQAKDKSCAFDLSLHFTQIGAWSHMNSLPLLIVTLELQDLDSLSFVLCITVQIKSAANQPTLKLEHIPITPLSYQQHSMEFAGKHDLFALKYLEGDSSESKFQIQMLSTKHLAEVEKKFCIIKQCIYPTPSVNLAKFTPQTQQTLQFSASIPTVIEEDSTFLCPSPIILSESVVAFSSIKCCPICSYREHEERKIKLVNDFIAKLGREKAHNSPMATRTIPPSALTIPSFVQRTLAFLTTVKSIPLLGTGERNLLKHQFLK